jgi:hypothetical protein
MAVLRSLTVTCVLIGGLALAACPGAVPPRNVADAPLGGLPDAPLGGPADAPLGLPDARPAADARLPDAMSGGPDAPNMCTDPSGQGVCIDKTVCTSSGKTATPGYCPGTPANIQCCTPLTLAAPAACDPSVEPQPNSGLSEEPGEGGCPAGMVRVGGDAGFCVDRFEDALEEQNSDGTTTPWSPYFNPGSHAVVARSLRGAVPQGYISGDQAKAACAAAGKRLCSNTEWLRACRGPDNLTFPYGPTREPGVCNDARAEHPAVELFGSVTNLSSPCINQLHDSLDRTGARSGCVTAEGAYDMMGNLHEWTDDAAGTFRGGFYVDTVLNGPGCQYVTTAHDTHYSDYSTGFRCCAD